MALIQGFAISLQISCCISLRHCPKNSFTSVLFPMVKYLESRASLGLIFRAVFGALFFLRFLVLEAASLPAPSTEEWSAVLLALLREFVVLSGHRASSPLLASGL